MEGSTGEGLIRGVAGARAVDLLGHDIDTADLEVQAGERVQPPPAGLEVRRVDHPLGVVLALAGELDLATASLLQERLDPAIRATATLVIDLSRLSFIDSSGLAMLVRAQRQLRDSGGHLVLVRGPRAVNRFFALTSLDSHFEFCDSPSAALRRAPARRIGPIAQPKPTDIPRPTSTANPEE